MAAFHVDETFEVAFVCTGNRARSALAEALFRSYAGDARAPVTVQSFGTLDVGPLPPLPAAEAAATALGVELRDHRARVLCAGALRRADLVLGFEPSHVAAAVVDGGADIGRTFLLGEIVSKLGPAAAPAESKATHARAVVATADSRRIRTRPDAAFAIADPFDRPDAMPAIAEEIERLVRRLAVALFGRAEVENDRPIA